MDQLRYYPILPNDRENPADIPEINKSYQNGGAGLCNQLYNIVNGIIYARMNNIDLCVIDSFMKCIYTKELCNIDKIIDLKKTSDEINKIPCFENTKLLDRITCKFEILEAEYGYKQDISNEVLSKLKQYCNNDGIIIPKNTQLNQLFGDLCYNVPKKLYMKIKLGDHIMSIYEDENINNINFNINHIKKTIFSRKFYTMGPANYYSEHLFNRLLNCIHYNPIFNEIIDDIINIRKLSNLKVIHLRVEDDVIKHFAWYYKKNNDFIRDYLYNLYKNAIKLYINSDDNIHVLTYDGDAIKKIFEPEYSISYIDNDFKTQLLKEKLGIYGRELNALFDLIIGIKIGKSFIGLKESTFSDTLAHYICNPTLIGMDIN